ncbi:hypothetical protein [Oceanibacterium hippocampi]|uniref:Uncharacterized protein n=1 Tax=Oceanibacterium hippocampi TaxID=745714 RepID=A0A1Y5S5E3_9PROT|nr:hypothetical protein [Oceanibacterium hippocampi]SLN31717.1 hypothetical protein OCH7691_01143 [Oceanibacterium hippocampi]
MATRFYNRVRETSTTTGTGTLTLGGAPTDYLTFAAAVPDGAAVAYMIIAWPDYEIGVGTFTAPDQLGRDTVLESSNGGSKVDWPAGTRDVIATAPGQLLFDLGGANALTGSLDITGGTLTGEIGTGNLAAGAVTNAKIADGTIGFSKIVQTSAAIADQATMEAGASSARWVTPLGTKQALDYHVPRTPMAGGTTNVISGSPSTIQFTSIPSWARRITIGLYDVSYTGGGLIVQIGPSAGVDTTGYVSAAAKMRHDGSGPEIFSNTATDGFLIGGTAETLNGVVTLLAPVAGEARWICAAHGMAGTAHAFSAGGRKAIASGILERITLRGSGITFTGGRVSITWEA